MSNSNGTVFTMVSLMNDPNAETKPADSLVSFETYLEMVATACTGMGVKPLVDLDTSVDYRRADWFGEALFTSTIRGGK